MDHPRSGAAAFRGCVCEFPAELAGDCEHQDSSRGPLLLISGKQDHTVPDVVTRSTFKQYRHSTAVTELQQIDNRRHSLTIDSGWRDVADMALNWLRARGL
jgi:alpha-beta hydrolase superfamily lysophospholipase